jgi:3-oxoacyl-[acyl-carrier-protein] synthase II
VTELATGRGLDVVVTGLGAVSALGTGCDALWAAVEAGRSGIGPLRRFSTDGLPVSIAATVPGRETAPATAELALELALAAAREALDGARLRDAPLGRVALVLGVSADLGSATVLPHHLTRSLADALGVGGPRLTVSTACTSSTNAVGLGRDLLRAGEVDQVLAGGVDVLTRSLFAGFHACGVLGPRPCAPFSAPEGMTLGEGAGFVVLERRGDAEARGARPRATVLGYGLSGDAYHETTPHPRGEGVARALRGAIADAGLDPDAVGYVNAHGTGTAANDGAEWIAIREVFGARAATLPVSSTKGHLGHAQAAAGVLEAIATVLAMERGRVPPTLNFAGPRALAPADPVGEGLPRPHDYDVALTTNSAFGGSNCAVVVGRPRAASVGAGARRPIALSGAAALGPAGAGLDELLAAALGGRAAGPWGAPLGLDLCRYLRGADPRGLNPAAVNLTAAATLALADAGVPSLNGGLRDRAGLVVGTTRGSPSSSREFYDSLEARGIARVSATAFSRVVLNASQGSCAKLLSIRGPQTTLTAGASSGLVAVVVAAELLASRADVDLVIAGATEERDDSPRSADAEAGAEGAACVVLGAGPDHLGEIDVAGWALAGPGGLGRATATALGRAGLAAVEVGAVFGRGAERATLGQGGAPDALHVDPALAVGSLGGLAAAVACAAAAAWLRRAGVRPGEAALAVDPGDGTASAALVLRRRT